MELTLDQALQEGIEAHKAGKAQEADRYYTAILKANPKHPDANHNMGVLAVGVGKVEAALPFFKTALEANPKIAQYWLSYIDALIKLDRIDDAKAVFDQAKSSGAKGDGFDQAQSKLVHVAKIEGHQTDEEILAKAVDLRESGKYNDAIDLLKNSISNFPRDPNVPAILSHCYILNDNLEQAKIYLDVAKNINPNIASVGWNETRLLLKQKKGSEALTVADKTNKLFPDDVEGMGVLGLCLRSIGSFGESLKYLNKAIELDPNYAEALINRGLIYLNKKDKANALTDLEKAHKLKPHINQIWHLVLSLKMEVNDFENTISLAEEMIKRDPVDEKIFATIALCYHHLNKYDDAVVFYKKAITIKPDYAEVHNNMGLALQEQGKLDDAIHAFTKALAINPDNPKAYSNIGIALQEQDKLDHAIEAYTKAISINPDYAEAYSNMGNALQRQGKLDDAIAAFNKALSINPDDPRCWNNLFFPLQALKAQVGFNDDLSYLHPKDNGSNYGKIALCVLNWKIHRGQESERIYIDQALQNLSKDKSGTIFNPKSNDSSDEQPHLSDKMVALVHFGRSGTGLMHSLIDGHPEVSMLPMYFSEYFDRSTWEKIISAGWDGMVDRFIEIYDVLFDATSSVPVANRGTMLIYNIGVKEGLANLGAERNEVLGIDKKIFRSELKSLLNCYEEMDAFIFFKLVHAAYDRAINDHNSKSLIFYHIHNPAAYAQLNFTRFDSEINWVMMVREPIQSCESWIRTKFHENDYFFVVTGIVEMLFEIDNVVYSNKNCVGIRLEDLKNMPRKTIPALCKWMGVIEKESLYEMTAQGKKWWGDPSSSDYSKDGMEPFGKTSINRKIGSIFSENDQYILRTLFYPFSVSFGYTEENEEQFKVDLQKIRPMINEMFDFEKKMAEQMQVSCEELIKSGSYFYLRSGLIERWNTLNEFHTYPKMIRPFKMETDSII